MRLRTTFKDLDTFLRMMQSLQRVAHKCVMRMNPSVIKIVCVADSDGTQVWCILKADSFFTNYRIESNYNGNEINVEVATDTLIQALRSAHNSDEVVMRLAKRDRDPLLSFSIPMMSTNHAKMDITQDVLIRILKPADVERIREPSCPVPDVHIVMPKLHKLRTVIDRMRGIDDNVRLSANREGEMSLSVEKDDVRIQTTWKGLPHPDTQAPLPESDPRPPSVHRAVQLDMKAVVRLFSAYVVESTTIACICDNLCAVFYIYVGDTEASRGVMTCYLPGLDMS